MKTYCYLGSRVKLGEKGICGFSVCLYDEENGTLKVQENIFPELNVGSIFINKEKGILYCVDERRELPGSRLGGGGQIAAFKISPIDGSLRELSRCPSYGPMPADVIQSGSYVLAVNHSTKNGHITYAERNVEGRYEVKVRIDESSLVLFAVNDKGAVTEPLDIFKAEGSGPREVQLGPHLHCIRANRYGTLFVSCDKGADYIYIFTIENDRLIKKFRFKTEEGYAPRYGVFHPTKPYLFVNCEFAPYIYSLRCAENGELDLIQCLRILPDNDPGPSKHGQSDIVITRDGKNIYELYRQLDEIFVYEVDQETGKLSIIQTLKSAGKLLRSCALSPDGRFLLVVANQSGQVISYPIVKDGTLGEPLLALEHTGAAHLAFYQI